MRKAERTPLLPGIDLTRCHQAMAASEAETALPMILAVRLALPVCRSSCHVKRQTSLAQTALQMMATGEVCLPDSHRARLPAVAAEEGRASAFSSSFFHQCSLIAHATAQDSRLWFAPGRPRTLPVLPHNREEAPPHVSPLRPHLVSHAPLLLCVQQGHRESRLPPLPVHGPRQPQQAIAPPHASPYAVAALAPIAVHAPPAFPADDTKMPAPSSSPRRE